MKKRRPRLKVIPDKAFRKIWDKANMDLSLSEYLNIFTNATAEKPYIDFKQYYLDYVETVDMLKSIYMLAHMSFREILDAAQVRKAEVSDLFCIPIRTVEEWYSGKNKCSPYIRLMLLREFHLLNLGSKYLKREADIKYLSTMPAVYERHEDIPGQGDILLSHNSYGHSHTVYSYVPAEDRERPERTQEEREFFQKYGFYPNRNVSW